MKKLLVLMLVLGIAATVSAVDVSLNPSGTQEVTSGMYAFDVVAADTEGYDWYLGIADETYGTIDSIDTKAAAGDDGSSGYFASYGGLELWQISTSDMSDPFDSIETGVQHTVNVDFTGSAIGEELTIGLYNDSEEVVDSITYSAVPEPLTIGLLGLGGLFIRRRK